MQNQYGWNLLEKPIEFSINANTTELSLTGIPSKARKVKLYVVLSFGTCYSDSTVTWSFYTRVDMIKIAGCPYNANAVSMNTENCALRLDERKIIEVSRNGNYPGPNFGGSVQILGYK